MQGSSNRSDTELRLKCDTTTYFGRLDDFHDAAGEYVHLVDWVMINDVTVLSTFMQKNCLGLLSCGRQNM